MSTPGDEEPEGLWEFTPMGCLVDSLVLMPLSFGGVLFAGAFIYGGIPPLWFVVVGGAVVNVLLAAAIDGVRARYRSRRHER